MQRFTVVERVVPSRYGENVWKVVREVPTTNLVTAATCDTKEQAEEVARLLNKQAESLHIMREYKWWEIWK